MPREYGSRIFAMPKVKRSRRANPKTSKAYSVNVVALWRGEKVVGNRSPLRAAKLLGILDATEGEKPEPTRLMSDIVGGPEKLKRAAYAAGYERGKAHRWFLKARSAGKQYGKATSSRATRHAARDMAKAWREGDKATIYGFKAGMAREGKGTYAGKGRNVGSFKGRAGQWLKGPGGRFKGSK